MTPGVRLRLEAKGSDWFAGNAVTNVDFVGSVPVRFSTTPVTFVPGGTTAMSIVWPRAHLAVPLGEGRDPACRACATASG